MRSVVTTNPISCQNRECMRARGGHSIAGDLESDCARVKHEAIPCVAGVVEIRVEGLEAVVCEVGDDGGIAAAVARVIVVREECRLRGLVVQRVRLHASATCSVSVCIPPHDSAHPAVEVPLPSSK